MRNFFRSIKTDLDPCITHHGRSLAVLLIDSPLSRRVLLKFDGDAYPPLLGSNKFADDRYRQTSFTLGHLEKEKAAGYFFIGLPDAGDQGVIVFVISQHGDPALVPAVSCIYKRRGGMGGKSCKGNHKKGCPFEKRHIGPLS